MVVTSCKDLTDVISAWVDQLQPMEVAHGAPPCLKVKIRILFRKRVR